VSWWCCCSTCLWSSARSTPRGSDLYGRAVIAPAAAVTLISGLVLVAETDVAWSTLWAAWSLVGLVLSLALGADADPRDQRRATAARRHPTHDTAWRLVQERRAATLSAINLLLLLSLLWAMIFKPSL
jgi:hypothetical protein